MPTAQRMVYSVLLSGMVLTGVLVPKASLAHPKYAELSYPVRSLTGSLPENYASSLLGGKWSLIGELIQFFIGEKIGDLLSPSKPEDRSPENKAPESKAPTNETTPNSCPESSQEITMPNFKTWYGRYSGYAIGWSDRGFLSVRYPGRRRSYSRRHRRRVRRVYLYSEGQLLATKNEWHSIPGTPYAYCINGSDGIIRAKFDENFSPAEQPSGISVSRFRHQYYP